MASKCVPYLMGFAILALLAPGAFAGGEVVSPVTQVEVSAPGAKAASAKAASAKATSARAASAKATNESAKKENKRSLSSLSENSKVQNRERMKEVTGEAVGEVDGIPLDKDADKPEKEGFTIGDLNPLKWIFKPVTDVRKEVKVLTKQITKMETPITSLQKPMVGLRQDMVTVHGQMGELHSDIGGVRHKMSDVDSSLGRVERNLTRIYEPVVKLKEPVQAMSVPVKNIHGNLVTLRSDMHGIKDVVGFTSTAILIAVIGMGFLVVVGTPIAALLAWRHRSSIMKFVGGNQQDVNNLHRDTDKAKARAASKP